MTARRPSHPLPTVKAIASWARGDHSQGQFRQLLSQEQQKDLSSISSVIRFRKGEIVYSHGEQAKAIYNIVEGVLKAYKTGTGEAEHIASFLYPGDVVGLAEEGLYVNSVKALTPVLAHSWPVGALLRSLPSQGELELQMIAKLCHELRETQRHALLLAQQPALSRLAMFLRLQEQVQKQIGGPAEEIYLPMSRTDIADYVGMSLAAVSRGFRSLMTEGIIAGRGRRNFRIVDRQKFEALAGKVEIL